MRTKSMKIATLSLLLGFSGFYANAANIIDEQKKQWGMLSGTNNPLRILLS